MLPSLRGGGGCHSVVDCEIVEKMKHLKNELGCIQMSADASIDRGLLNQRDQLSLLYEINFDLRMLSPIYLSKRMFLNNWMPVR